MSDYNRLMEKLAELIEREYDRFGNKKLGFVRDLLCIPEMAEAAMKVWGNSAKSEIKWEDDDAEYERQQEEDNKAGLIL